MSEEEERGHWVSPAALGVETQAGEGTAWERDKTLHQLPLGSTWALSADQLLSSRILCLTTSNISSPVAFKSKRDPDPRIP